MSRAHEVTVRTPLYFTFAIALLCYSSVASSRIVVSLYALALGAQPSTVGLLFATYYVFPFVLAWPIGRYADRVGSRWLLALGCVGGIVGILMPFLVRTLPAMFVAGTLVGLSFAFYNVLLQNLAGLLSRPEERARNFGTLSMVASVGNFIGPLVGGFAIDHVGHAIACLWIVALPAIALSLLVLVGGVLPAAKPHTAKVETTRASLVDSRIVRILATSSLVQVGQDLFVFALPIYGYAIGLSAFAIGSILASYAFASFVVRILMPRLIHDLGEQKLLACAFYLTAISSLIVPFLDNAVALAVVSFVFGFGMGCGLPVTTMMMFSSSEEGRSGETLGLRQTVNNLMRIGCPVIFGFVASVFGILPCFWINALMMGGGGWLSHPRRGER
jgi:MFS family permease